MCGFLVRWYLKVKGRGPKRAQNRPPASLALSPQSEAPGAWPCPGPSSSPCLEICSGLGNAKAGSGNRLSGLHGLGWPIHFQNLLQGSRWKGDHHPCVTQGEDLKDEMPLNSPVLSEGSRQPALAFQQGTIKQTIQTRTNILRPLKRIDETTRQVAVLIGQLIQPITYSRSNQ